MGKATRWFKGLLGMKKDKENVKNNSNSNYGEKKEKRRWSFAKTGKDSGGLTQIPVTDGAWMRSYVDETEKEQNKHAIAVAAATAAVADAALAAAQAAVAVVRLTNHGRGGLFHGGRTSWAAIKIQTVFRGFLARKALRALRGLVKLQAVVRGFLVRKRAAATLYSMEALIRAQTAVRCQRNRRSISNDYRFQPDMRARKSVETKSEFHSKRTSASHDLSHNAFDENSKIVEVDTHNPGSRSRSRRINTCASQCCDDQYYQGIPSPVRVRLSIPDHRDFDCNYYMDENYKFSTAQSTPRFASCGRANGPVTPTKSVCGDSFFRPYSSNCPNYMSNTQSFRAKLRSLSAPKQRPDSCPKNRLSLNEIMASRTSFTGVRMQRSSSQVQQDFD